MHDTLEYFKKDPIYREFHQSQITFSIYYAFNENFMLPLSHDEVVHGKGSLINKMPGDSWQKFANLRLLYTYMFMHPGAKLLFMGQEFAQYDEWNHEKSLDWSLLENEANNGIKKLISDLNLFYKNNKTLHELNFNKEGFEWVDIQDAHNSVISFLRKDKEGNELLIVGNFTPVLRNNYKVGVNHNKNYEIIFNSDSFYYGGSNSNTQTTINAAVGAKHNRPFNISLNLPPLGMVVLRAVEK
jgi:1,4-alpha-glucan branching enzyme